MPPSPSLYTHILDGSSFSPCSNTGNQNRPKDLPWLWSKTAKFPALSGPNKRKRASTVWCRCTKTQWLKENWVLLCYICNKLALEFLPLCEFHTGTQDKLYNLKLSVNLSVKWHRTPGGTFHQSEKSTHFPL